MRKETMVISIASDSELGRALDGTAGEPVILLRGTSRFRVTRGRADPWEDYDPESVLEGLCEIAGTLSPAEGERMKDLIYRGREDGARPLDRP